MTTELKSSNLRCWNEDKGMLHVREKIWATFKSKALKGRRSVFVMKTRHSIFFKEAIDKVQLDDFKTDWTAGEILVNLKCVCDITVQLLGGQTKAQSPNKMGKWLKILFTILKVSVWHMHTVFVIDECHLLPLTSVSTRTHTKPRRTQPSTFRTHGPKITFSFLKRVCFNFIYLTSNNLSQIIVLGDRFPLKQGATCFNEIVQWRTVNNCGFECKGTCRGGMLCTQSLLHSPQQSCWRLRQGRTWMSQPPPLTVCEPIPCYPAQKKWRQLFCKLVIKKKKNLVLIGL